MQSDSSPRPSLAAPSPAPSTPGKPAEMFGPLMTASHESEGEVEGFSLDSNIFAALEEEQEENPDASQAAADQIAAKDQVCFHILLMP